MTLPSNSQSSPHQANTSKVDVRTASPNVSPQSSPTLQAKSPHHKRESSNSSSRESVPDKKDEGHKTSDGSGGELSRSSSQEPVKDKDRKALEKNSRKKAYDAPWYSAVYPTYKSKSEDFKKLFKDVPCDERLVVDYSCAIQKDILVHGRLYVSQNYLGFYANIFRWETQVCLRWKDVTALTKEKTALVIPNAILVHTQTDKHFLTSFTSRDKAYLMLFRVWQNALMDQQVFTQEMWQWVHHCYGDELGLTSDDDDYIDPSQESKRPLMIKPDLPVESEEGLSMMNEEKESVTLPSRPSSLSLEPAEPPLSGPSTPGTPTSDSNDDRADSVANVAKELLIRKNNHFPSDRKKTFFRSLSHQPKTNRNGNATPVSPLVDEAKTKSFRKQLLSTFSHPSSPVSSKREFFLKEGAAAVPLQTDKKNPGTAQIPIELKDQPLTPGSPSDQLPTDLSDSSPSESESEKHGSAINCPINHDGKPMLHMQVSIHVDQLFAHLFTNSKFFVDLHENIKSTDVKQSAWITNPSTNQKGRTVNLTVQLGQAIGPRHAHVTESQQMLPCSKPGELYVIEVEASNAGIPYADAFYIHSHYCLTRGDDPGTSNIAVYCQIKYRKSVWALAKSYIEKNCWAGMEEYYCNLVKALEVECERTRRAMASSHHTKRKVIRRTRSTVQKPLSITSPDIEEKPLIQPLPIPNKIIQQPADSLIWIVFFVLFILLVLNAALYYKLWGLEQNEKNFIDPSSFIDANSLRKAPQTPEEWQNLLRKQEQLHSFEIDRWLQILKASVHLLQQVEKSLSVLQNSIQGVVEDAVLSFKDEPNETLPSDEL